MSVNSSSAPNCYYRQENSNVEDIKNTFWKVKEKSKIIPYQNKSLEDMKDEFWQEIPGFDGFLLLSNFGRIKSLARFVERKNGAQGYWTKDKILSLTVQKIKNNFSGDFTFHLFCKVGYNGKRINLNIRRLVYTLFVDSTLEKTKDIG